MHSPSSNPGHQPFYVRLSLSESVSTGFHTKNRITQSNSILLSPLSRHLLALRPSVCPSVRLAGCAGTKRRGPRSVCFSDKYFPNRIIPLIALLSTSFPSCLPMRPVKVAFKGRIQAAPISCPISHRSPPVPCQKAGTLCFDDRIISCLFPAKICLF